MEEGLENSNNCLPSLRCHDHDEKTKTTFLHARHLNFLLIFPILLQLRLAICSSFQLIPISCFDSQTAQFNLRLEMPRPKYTIFWLVASLFLSSALAVEMKPWGRVEGKRYPIYLSDRDFDKTVKNEVSNVFSSSIPLSLPSLWILFFFSSCEPITHSDADAVDYCVASALEQGLPRCGSPP